MKSLKETGRTAIICMEKYAKKIKDQKYSCHRDILADMILNFTTSNPLFEFDKRVDL